MIVEDIAFAAGEIAIFVGTGALVCGLIGWAFGYPWAGAGIGAVLGGGLLAAALAIMPGPQ